GRHLLLLDRFGGLDSERAAFSEVAGRIAAITARLADLQQADADAETRADFLRFQLEEIEAGGFTSDEEAALEAEHKRLVNVQALLAAAHEAYEALHSDDHGAYDRVAV